MLAGELEVIGRTASIGHVQHCQIHTVQPEILAVIKFGGLPPNRVFADLKLAVWNSIAIHTCTRYKFWRIFNLVVSPKTAKLPNLIPRQIFWLYGNIISMR